MNMIVLLLDKLVMLTQTEQCTSRTASEDLVRTPLGTWSMSHSLGLMNGDLGSEDCLCKCFTAPVFREGVTLRTGSDSDSGSGGGDCSSAGRPAPAGRSLLL